MEAEAALALEGNLKIHAPELGIEVEMRQVASRLQTAVRGVGAASRIDACRDIHALAPVTRPARPPRRHSAPPLTPSPQPSAYTDRSRRKAWPSVDHCEPACARAHADCYSTPHSTHTSKCSCAPPLVVSWPTLILEPLSHAAPPPVATPPDEFWRCTVPSRADPRALAGRVEPVDLLPAAELPGNRRVEIAACTTSSRSRGTCRNPSVRCTSAKWPTMKPTQDWTSSASECRSAMVSTSHTLSTDRLAWIWSEQSFLSRSIPKRSAAASSSSTESAVMSAASVYRWSSKSRKTAGVTSSTSTTSCTRSEEQQRAASQLTRHEGGREALLACGGRPWPPLHVGACAMQPEKGRR
eukprot:scaffold1553_cov132-Isochrysis_galbana.AAC.8